MGRPTKPMVLNEEDRAKLREWARRLKTTQRLPLRARIVLGCADGMQPPGSRQEPGAREAIGEMLTEGERRSMRAESPSMARLGFMPSSTARRPRSQRSTVTVEKTIADEDKVCVRWSCVLKHTGLGWAWYPPARPSKPPESRSSGSLTENLSKASRTGTCLGQIQGHGQADHIHRGALIRTSRDLRDRPRFAPVFRLCDATLSPGRLQFLNMKVDLFPADAGQRVSEEPAVLVSLRPA